MLQPLIVRAIRRGLSSELDDDAQTSTTIDHTATGNLPSATILLWQFFVGIYGGYFGAGVGILTLAGLGFMGMTNIHRMNGLKNWGGLCMNAVAAVMFAFTSLVSWPIALTMAAGSIAGGYLGARAAQRTPQRYVRRAVIAIGLAGGFWLLLHQH
jgi:uncharacterized membrane protein YfcA